MTEKRVPAMVFSVYAICKCGAEMLPDGTRLDSNPPWYPHYCNRCGNRESLREVYPRQQFIDKQEGQDDPR